MRLQHEPFTFGSIRNIHLDLRSWQGQVYHKQYAKTSFARECLGEYCQYLYNGQPLFRTVGNDSTFYRPPTPNQLRNYLKQIPEDFEMCFKLWEELTIPAYTKQPPYGLKAGQPNARFLDAQAFIDLVLMPFREAKFEPHTEVRQCSLCSRTIFRQPLSVVIR